MCSLMHSSNNQQAGCRYSTGDAHRSIDERHVSHPEETDRYMSRHIIQHLLHQAMTLAHDTCYLSASVYPAAWGTFLVLSMTTNVCRATPVSSVIRTVTFQCFVYCLLSTTSSLHGYSTCLSCYTLYNLSCHASVFCAMCCMFSLHAQPHQTWFSTRWWGTHTGEHSNSQQKRHTTRRTGEICIEQTRETKEESPQRKTCSQLQYTKNNR